MIQRIAEIFQEKKKPGEKWFKTNLKPIDSQRGKGRSTTIKFMILCENDTVVSLTHKIDGKEIVGALNDGDKFKAGAWCPCEFVMASRMTTGFNLAHDTKEQLITCYVSESA